MVKSSFPDGLDFLSLTKAQFYSNKVGWVKSFDSGICQDDVGNELPWMTYPFIEFLKQKLQSQHTVFEFGCGNSTIFFAQKVKRVVAVETDEVWFEMVREKLRQKNLDNVELLLMKDAFDSADYENLAKNYDAKFNFIVVDSIKRNECCRASIDALAPEGMIVLDDSERANYKKIFDFFAAVGFVRQDFYGIEPGRLRVKGSSVLVRN